MRVLTFVPNYLPGYKAGGILRTIANTVDWLADDVDFWIVTQDRDLNECNAYPGIKSEQWQLVGGAMVYYRPPRFCTLKHLATLISSTPHDVLYLNSFFDMVFTLKILVARKLGLIPVKPIILAPRGELVEGCLRIKSRRKRIFIHAAKMIGLYEQVSWHASSEYEARDFAGLMNVGPERIHVALDLPPRADFKIAADAGGRSVPEAQGLRIIFLSRLTREKNLDYALGVLARIRSEVIFDIVGPQEDPVYWDECSDLIRKLPPHVRVNYLGVIRPEQVPDLFRKHDLFFFPTTGENYGHVIAEALAAGTPVLISNTTPWRDLEADGLGWVRALDAPDAFARIIEELASLTPAERAKGRIMILDRIMQRLRDPAVLEANRQLFRGNSGL